MTFFLVHFSLFPNRSNYCVIQICMFRNEFPITFFSNRNIQSTFGFKCYLFPFLQCNSTSWILFVEPGQKFHLCSTGSSQTSLVVTNFQMKASFFVSFFGHSQIRGSMVIGLTDHFIFVNVSAVCQNKPILHSHPSLVLKWHLSTQMYMEYRVRGEICPKTCWSALSLALT